LADQGCHSRAPVHGDLPHLSMCDRISIRLPGGSTCSQASVTAAPSPSNAG
jgi:hypothetical protein